MTSPSLIHAARMAPDALERIHAMADLMRDVSYGGAAPCTYDQIHAGGFTAAEIKAYHDDAIAVIEGRPSAMRHTRPGKREGRALAVLAEAIGQARERRCWQRPRIGSERIGRHGR